MGSIIAALRQVALRGPRVLVCSLLAVALLGAGAAGADDEQPGGPDYRLRPGDSIEVFLWNEGDTPTPLTVDATGQVSYPLVGVITVKGLTLKEVAERMIAGLREHHIRNPRVTVVLKGVKPQSAVYVMGAVNKPGPYEWTETMRVSDALGLAGGLAPGADGARASINNPNKGSVPLNLEKLLFGGDASLNLPLNAGDTIVVPMRELKNMLSVMIVGQVNRPGSLQLSVGARLSDAMTAAGGPTPMAALKRGTLARGGVNATVDLDAILRRGELSGNLALQDGDVLLVPEGRYRVTLLGEFTKPGSYPYKHGDSVTDAVSLGEGPTTDADLEAAILKRGSTETPVNLKALLEDGRLSDDRPLEDGDVLVIPSGLRILTLGAVRRPGAVALKRGMKLVDVLVEVGGLGENARADKATVVRMVDGKPKPIPLNIKDAVQKGGAAYGFAFAKGDVLYVPEKGRPFEWGNILSAIYALGVTGIF